MARPRARNLSGRCKKGGHDKATQQRGAVPSGECVQPVFSYTAFFQGRLPFDVFQPRGVMYYTKEGKGGSVIARARARSYKSALSHARPLVIYYFVIIIYIFTRVRSPPRVMARNDESARGTRGSVFFRRGDFNAGQLPVARSALYIQPVTVNQRWPVSTTTTDRPLTGAYLGAG